MNGLPMLPAIIIDVAGSTANIVFAFLATRYAYKLTRLKPGNFLWGYLFYVTLAISAFAGDMHDLRRRCQLIHG